MMLGAHHRIVVEITRGSVRVLAVSPGAGGRPKVSAWRIAPIGDEPPGDVLRRLLSGLPAASAEIISVIPREQLIVRLLKLPATQPQELSQMVELSGKAQLPYPREQAVAAFDVVQTQSDGTLIQLAACHRDVIDRHLAVLRHAGLEPAAMVPSSWGVVAWYQQAAREAGSREPVMLVNVDAEHTDVVLVQDGRLMLSRSLSQGRREWQQAADPSGTLAQEIERSLDSLRKDLPELSLGSVLVTGVVDGAAWPERLAERLNRPVAVRPPAGPELPLPSVPTDASPVVSLGLALAAPDARAAVNLLPQDITRVRRHRLQLHTVTVSIGLLLAGVVMGALTLSAYAARQTRWQSQVETRLGELAPATRALERKQRDVRLIEQVLVGRRHTAERLAELLRTTPEELVFEAVGFDRARGEWSVRGSAQSTRQVLDFIATLEATGRWSRIELKYSAQRSVGEAVRTEFELSLHAPEAS